MKTTVEFTQTKTIEIDAEGTVIYKVHNVVNYIENIPSEIFTYVTETEKFSHVATMWDIYNVPGSRQQALTENIDYYRTSIADMSYENMESAQRFAAHVYSRVSELVRLYSVGRNDFPGEVRRVVVDNG